MSVRPYNTTLPSIGERVYIDPQAAVIGAVTIGDDSSVWPMAVVRGDVNAIRIGCRTSVQDGSVLHVTHDHPEVAGGHPLTIGDEVTIGHNVTLHGCHVGNRSLIGIGAIVLDGAVIEEHVILAAGSLVPPQATLAGGYLWMGSPARRIRPLSQGEIDKFEYSARHYVKLQGGYRRQG